MPTKEWYSNYAGHHITVSNYWGFNMQGDSSAFLPFTGLAKLYVDGECVDTSNSLFSRGKRPCLRGRIVHNGYPYVVEVYLISELLGVGARIEVDGKEIATTIR
jgi:hypothetical protein